MADELREGAGPGHRGVAARSAGARGRALRHGRSPTRVCSTRPACACLQRGRRPDGSNVRNLPHLAAAAVAFGFPREKAVAAHDARARETPRRRGPGRLARARQGRDVHPDRRRHPGHALARRRRVPGRPRAGPDRQAEAAVREVSEPATPAGRPWRPRGRTPRLPRRSGSAPLSSSPPRSPPGRRPIRRSWRARESSSPRRR